MYRRHYTRQQLPLQGDIKAETAAEHSRNSFIPKRIQLMCDVLEQSPKGPRGTRQSSEISLMGQLNGCITAGLMFVCCIKILAASYQTLRATALCRGGSGTNAQNSYLV